VVTTVPLTSEDLNIIFPSVLGFPMASFHEVSLTGKHYGKHYFSHDLPTSVSKTYGYHVKSGGRSCTELLNPMCEKERLVISDCPAITDVFFSQKF
jgi:hypothetical protein